KPPIHWCAGGLGIPHWFEAPIPTFTPHPRGGQAQPIKSPLAPLKTRRFAARPERPILPLRCLSGMSAIRSLFRAKRTCAGQPGADANGSYATWVQRPGVGQVQLLIDFAMGILQSAAGRRGGAS